ncbi:hypothetical protein UlMin_015975 [Ulmus minor]
MGSKKEVEIPVIDLSKESLKVGTSSWVTTCKNVCHTLEEYGCFVAKLSDDVLSELHDRKFLGALEELFDFSKEIKAKNTFEKAYFANFKYSAFEALGIENAIEPGEVFNFAKLFWPNDNDSFRFLKYISEDKDKKLNAFPEHIDLSFSTLIHEIDVSGLQIQTKDGEWIGFDVSPSSFIYIAGDALQVWSNNRIKPGFHRVIVGENNVVRYFLTFHTFIKGNITVRKEFVDEQHPLRYKPMDHLQYVQSQLGHNTKIFVKRYSYY